MANEAVANTVKHAYPPEEPGWVQISADLIDARGGLRTVVSCVSDQGRRRPTPADQPYLGHGVALMRALTESLRIDTTASGTRVIATSYPVRTPRGRPSSEYRSPSASW